VSSETASPVISNRLLAQFVAAATQEVGADKLPLVLALVNLSPTVIEKESISRLDGRGAAEIYACLQQALRMFYGRGVRGILLRIGHNIWEQMVAQATFREKTELEIARRLPVPARRRRMLENVAERLREGGGGVSVHLMDMDLLLVDRSGASTCGQAAEEPICYVTLGLIQGALYWATGQEADVEEVTCRAMGAPACEFKIKLGGD
jgi:predicted hydrocarbon binding protein